MSLSELLASKGIRRALIADDVYDAVPKAAEIDPGNEAWPTFNDDLSREQRDLIEAAHPAAKEARFEALIESDAYVAAVWSLRDRLGDIVAPVFASYVADQSSDRKYVELARRRLEALGLECRTVGRNFHEEAQVADFILIDLFFTKQQDAAALEEAKAQLRNALATRMATPPIVILMSRSPRLESKRDEFRDDVGLLDSAFRIIRKADLEDTDRLERQLERLAENASDSRKLAQFFAALEAGMAEATSRTLKLLRKLRLSDIGQIQQLLLDVEGEAVGSYLVDVFDRVLQHEIEREVGIIEAALALNEFSAVRHPPPYVAGSPDLQALMQRLLSQNEERLRLPGSVGALVTFGDVLMASDAADLRRLQQTLLVEMAADKLLLVLTPACDLQRGGAPRMLLLVGTQKLLDARGWSYGGDIRTASISLEGRLRGIRWQVKHIDTVSREGLEKALEDGDLRIVARLREAHALEVQQRVLSGLGRVGLVAALPATFPVDVEAYVAGMDRRPRRLDVPALTDGAVCFVGRDEDRKPVLRLVLTEGGCDGLVETLTAVDVNAVADEARTAFGHVTSTSDLRHMLTSGLDLKNATDKGWSHIPSLTGSDKKIQYMGLLAWGYPIPDASLPNRDLNKAGVILLIRDVGTDDAPGLNAAIREGLVEVKNIEAEEAP